MTTIDSAEVMARHAGHSSSALREGGCSVNPAWRETPEDRCDTYRLAEALSQALSELERIAGHTRDAYDQRDSAQAALSKAWQSGRLYGAGSSAEPYDPYARSADA